MCFNVLRVCVLCRYEYQWCDGVEYKRPTALPAQQYTSLLMDWVEAQINNEDIFPVSVGTSLCQQPLSLTTNTTTQPTKHYNLLTNHHQQGTN